MSSRTQRRVRLLGVEGLERRESLSGLRVHVGVPPLHHFPAGVVSHVSTRVEVGPRGSTHVVVGGLVGVDVTVGRHGGRFPW